MPTSAPAVVSFEGVTCRYSDLVAVDEVTLRVAPVRTIEVLLGKGLAYFAMTAVVSLVRTRCSGGRRSPGGRSMPWG